MILKKAGVIPAFCAFPGSLVSWRRARSHSRFGTLFTKNSATIQFAGNRLRMPFMDWSAFQYVF
ncbi:hypothetical protein X971_0486 [Agrobacterium tumefaciens LBA4213 (Ach5)]|nr:hypothetical protein X971_0486 [Agrobacterium tumefaciens LBA4213 (Ach5)]